jgi:hypothetical protein
VIYNCCHENRKARVRNQPGLNGIDYLEVLDSISGFPAQRTLLVYCLNRLTQTSWSTDNVLIKGGESITNIAIDWVGPAAADSPSSLPGATPEEQNYFSSLPYAEKILVVRTHVAGDFSTYRLRLVNSASDASKPGPHFEVTEALDGFDPQLADVSFSFKVECGPNFDCKPQTPNCARPGLTPPPINYLAKDYGSFRTLMLDRLNQLLPGWGSASEADFGVALAELIAYVGDRLSYQQDAIATEAYLETARSRISLRRHALLVDYRVHDGCNARVWIQLSVSGNAVYLDHTKTRFYTFAPGMPAIMAGNEEIALRNGVQFYEPMQDGYLYAEQNAISFYTWGDEDCCLPKGATEATLVGSLKSLQPGDVLIFKEVIGPQTGDVADADIRHRCAVRLTNVTTQNGTEPLQDDLTSPPTLLTEIQWSSEDALPFPLCLSSSDLDSNVEVSKAYGNVVLADHGLSVKCKPLGTVPQPRIYQPPDSTADRCQPAQSKPVPVRFRPIIPDSPITQAVPSPLPSSQSMPVTGSPPIVASPPQNSLTATASILSASKIMDFDPKEAVPVITLEGAFDDVSSTWKPEQDLLESGDSDPNFVVEVEADGTATLRFGDDANGQRPDSGTVFTANYRIGNGAAGNVGPDSITRLDTTDPIFNSFSCSNPLPATGGTDPETNDQIRRRAPQAFLTQERAVTPADYEAAAGLNPLVNRASAVLRWTGSWYTVFLTVEPEGGGNLSQSLEKSLKKSVGAWRLAGQDLQLDSPQYVSLQIELSICVDPDYFNADVQQALLQVLSNRVLPNGQKGLFYPDNFTFGKKVYLSKVYAAARSVPGVIGVTAETFGIQGTNTDYTTSGEIPMGHLQVARLDNDPSFPDHGQLTLHMEGGK